MNITETKRQIRVAFEQANISERKMNYFTIEENWQAAFVYKVRMRALRLLAIQLQQELKKHESKTFKQVNNAD
jgi:hypothetical protein